METYTLSQFQKYLLNDILIKYPIPPDPYEICSVLKGPNSQSLPYCISTVQSSFDILFKCYSSLRLRLKKEDNYYKQYLLSENITIQNNLAQFVSIDLKTTTQSVNELAHLYLRRQKNPTDPSYTPTILFCYSLNENDSSVDTSWVFFYIHHLFMDGYSNRILIQPCLEQLFVNLNKNTTNTVILSLSYLDYINYQDTISYDSELLFLTSYLQPNKEYVAELPYDHLFQLQSSYIPGHFFLPTRFNSSIRSKTRLSSYFSFVGFVYILLYKLTHQSYINIGLTTNGRPNETWAHVSGMFANTFVSSLQLDSSVSISEWLLSLQYLKELVFSYGHVPLQYVLQSLNLSYSPGYSPLYQVAIMPGFKEQKDAWMLNQDCILTTRSGSIYDLAFNLSEILHLGYIIDIRYNQTRFQIDTIKRIGYRLQQLFLQIETSENVSDFDIRLPDEIGLYRQCLQSNSPENQPFSFDPVTDSVASVIYYQTLQNLEHISLIYEDSKLTYYELYSYASQFCHTLQQKWNVLSGDIVIVRLPRSFELVISILAIWIAGAVYCPLSLYETNERVNTIITNTNAKCIVTIITQETYSIPITTIRLNSFIQNADLVQPSKFSELAYVIHTSGSTGVPKGACIRHSSLFNLYNTIKKQVKSMAYSQRVLQFYAITFDPHIQDIAFTLMFGSTLVLLREEKFADPIYIVNQIIEHQVNAVSFTPSFFDTLYNQTKHIDKWGTSIHTFSFIGEPLKGSHVNKVYDLNPNAMVVNLFGPVELTIEIYIYEFKAQLMNPTDDIHIGTPVQYTNCLLFRNGAVILPGQIGELYVSGENLMKEYIANPEQTKKAFITYNGVQYYKTGDLFHWNINGTLTYVQRVDHQVKIRGQRLELGEIENCVQNFHSSISNVLVKKETIPSTHEDCLVCYFSQHIDNYMISSQHLYAYCIRLLPRWMVPSFYVRIDHWPLSANGKIDRSKLSCPFQTEHLTTEKVEYNPLKTAISQVCSSVLKQECNPDVLFSSLGINSLDLLKLIQHFNRTYQTSISISQMFSIHCPLDFLHYLSSTTVPIQLHSQSEGPATKSQSAIYMHQLFSFFPSSSVYTIHKLYQFTNTITSSHIHRICKELLRIPLFRTIFKYTKQGLRQVILDTYHEDCKDVSVITDDLYKKFFHVDAFPLFRIRYSMSQQLMLFQCHHILYDHGCDDLLESLFEAIVHDQKIEIDPITMIDIALYENTIPINLQSEQFWCHYLDPTYAYIDLLPYQYTRLRNGDSCRFYWRLSQEQTISLQRLAQYTKCTLHTTVLALFSTFIHQTIHSETFYIGSVYHNRMHPQLYSAMGYLMKLLSYRSQYIPNESTLDTINRWSYIVQEVQIHCDYPISHLYPKNVPLEHKKKTPYCSILFTEVSLKQSKKTLTFTPQINELMHRSIFPLTHFLTKADDIIFGWIDGDCLNYQEEDIRRLVVSWEQYLHKELLSFNKR
jgi:amino acid adenylation domain-containing protein